MTLSRYFLKLCSNADLTNMHEIARRAGIDPSTPWKIKAGRPVRAKTLGSVLGALGYCPKDAEYRQAFALWGAEVVGLHGGRALGQGMAAGVARVGAKGTASDRLRAAFDKALPRIPQAQWDELRRVLEENPPSALAFWLLSRR